MERTTTISHPNKTRSSIFSGPTSKSLNQRQKIIELLRRNGKAGLLTSDFLRIPIARYSSRLRELRQQGYGISTERITEGCYKYVLRFEPPVPKELPNFEPRQKEPAESQPPLFAVVGR
jgi:hypothetical protein